MVKSHRGTTLNCLGANRRVKTLLQHCGSTGQCRWTFESQREKTYLRKCAPSEDSDQPAHLCSLIRIFTVRILDTHGCNVSSCGKRRLWSDCADAQADLSSLCAYVRRYCFSSCGAFNARAVCSVTTWFSESNVAYLGQRRQQGHR